MKFDKTEVFGMESATRGMRNPLESWHKSDSYWGNNEYSLESYVLGENDISLMQKLIKAGPEHRKFLRQIFIQTEIEANVYEWLKMENKFIEKSDLPDNIENMQNIKRSVSMNYEVAYSTKHKYGKDYDNWLKTLPYSNELIFIEEEDDK